MTTFYLDQEGGSNLNGGTSFAVLATGTDGAFSGTNFNSAAVTFDVSMVGQAIGFDDGAGYYDYVLITAFVDAHNVTVETGYGTMSPINFRVGGRWWALEPDAVGADPLNGFGGNLGDGDDFRYMASPAPITIGNATWANLNPDVDFADTLCAIIDDITSNWTIANSATTGTSATPNSAKGTPKGSVNAYLQFPSSVATNTKYGYKTLGAPLDLSAWQRLSFWFRKNGTTGTSFGTGIRLCLCSDTLGNTIVNEVVIPFPQNYDTWFPLVLDSGGALGATINSIAIYSGATAPTGSTRFYMANLIAVKPAGDPLEFSLDMLIGKVHNKYWEASTAFSTGDKRKPTPPNRNGFRYEATTGGTTGASEPVWPLILGETVADGSVVWTCEGPEDTWWPILHAVDGNTVRIFHSAYGNESSTYHNAFFMEAETCQTLLRKPLRIGATSNNPHYISPWNWNGTYDDPVTTTGGWNRTDMSTQNSETWFSAERRIDSTVFALEDSSNWYTLMSNFGIVRSTRGVNMRGGRWENTHVNGCDTGVVLSGAVKGFNVQANGCYVKGISRINLNNANRPATGYGDLDRVVADGNRGVGAAFYCKRGQYLWARNNLGGSLQLEAQGFHPEATLRKAVVLGLSSSTGICTDSGQFSGGATYKLIDCESDQPLFFTDLNCASKTILVNFNGDGRYRVHSRDATNPIMEVETGGNRHTLAGVAWKVNLDSHTRYMEMVRQEFKVALPSGSATTVSIWVKRIPTAGSVDNIHVHFTLIGGTIDGYEFDVSDAATAASDTWEQLSLVITPATAGVAVFELQMGMATNNTGTVYFDDFGVA